MPTAVSSWILIVPTDEAWVVRMRTTPDQIKSPASVTTNDGTPGLRDHERLDEADRGRARERDEDRRPPRPAWDRPGRRSSVITTPPTALTNATERSISPIRSTNTTPMAIVAIADICSRRFVKFRSVRNVSSRMPKTTTMTTSPTMIGQRPELAGSDSLPPEVQVAAEARAGNVVRERIGGDRLHPRGRRIDGRIVDRPVAHASALSSSRIPGTWSSVPAVMACTTSCWVVLARSSKATRWPSRRTVIRSAHLEDVVQVVGDDHDSEIPFRQALDEIEHLARLGDAERRGGLVEDDEPGVPHHRLRHRDRLSLASREPGDRLPNRFERRDREAVQRLPRGALHARLVEHEAGAGPLPPEEHVGDDVEVVREREILVDDLDAELGGVARAVDVDVGRRRSAPRPRRRDRCRRRS